jgi:biopolymer transport protein TolQ
MMASVEGAAAIGEEGFDRAGAHVAPPRPKCFERAVQTRQVLRHLHMLAPSPVSPVLAVTNIVEIFERSDVVGQVITVGLAVFSLIAWTIMFGKHFELKRLRSLNMSFESHLRDQRSLLDLPESFRNKRAIPYADVFADAVESYWRAAAIGREKGTDTAHARLEHAENAIQRALARQTLRYESSMIFLA